MRVGSGCLLMVLGIIILLVIIVVPVIPPTADNKTVDDYLAALLCQPNETVVRDQYSFRDSDGTSYSMDVYCQNSERQREDVTGKWGLFGVVGFLVPLLLGVGVIALGARRKSAASDDYAGTIVTNPTSLSSASGSTPPVVIMGGGAFGNVELKDGVLHVGGVEIPVNHLTPAQIETFKERVRANFGEAGGIGAAGGTDFVAKLKQIGEARDAGLITAEEYDKLRQEILDSMG